VHSGNRSVIRARAGPVQAHVAAWFHGQPVDIKRKQLNGTFFANAAATPAKTASRA
jgi:hypothetical protein